MRKKLIKKNRRTSKPAPGDILDEVVFLGKLGRLQNIPEGQRRLIEARERFEAAYYSNKFEGNKLSKREARLAILIE
jgi:hypothetical protein